LSYPSRGLPSEPLLELVRWIAAHDTAKVELLLARAPELAKVSVRVGASREAPEPYYFPAIQHYVYAGDTALHMAAASHDSNLCERLLQLGADISAKNRRGAQPLHYAADTNYNDLEAQRSTIRSLCKAGAAVNAFDKSGVAPVHRAVRTRGATAVAALLEAGADARLRNKTGSTPLHLAVQNTGRGGTGSANAVAAQREIIQLLLARGARASDEDGHGSTVLAAAQADWIVALLTAPASPLPSIRS
jgi:ankyrin repeat protein